MSTIRRAIERDVRYHLNAYQFVYAALRFTQQCLERTVTPGMENLDAHISGVELLEGIRRFRAHPVRADDVHRLSPLGIRSTDDFGNIVFELIEHSEMSKTERDRLSDFFDVYDFADVFDRDYRVEVQRAFTK